MTNVDIKRICIHECCHAVVARLFRQRMAMEELVVNTRLVKAGEDLGALNIRGPRLDDEQDYAALAITLLAGVIGENIYLLGTDAIKEKKEEIVVDNNIIDWTSGGGDVPAFQNVAFMFSLVYLTDGNKLKEFCLRFLIDFLSDKEVWSMVELLCYEGLRKKNLKLNEKELECVFKKISLDALLDNKRKEYLNQCNEVLQFCQRSEPA